MRSRVRPEDAPGGTGGRRDELTGTGATYAATVLQEDRVDVLHRVLAECVTALDAAAAALLVEVDQRLELLGATAYSAQHVELWQLMHDRGPCVDVIRERRALVVPDLASVSARWPDFAAPLAAAGFAGIVALPLRWRGTTYGGLNLFATRPGTCRPTSWSRRSRTPTWPASSSWPHGVSRPTSSPGS